VMLHSFFQRLSSLAGVLLVVLLLEEVVRLGAVSLVEKMPVYSCSVIIDSSHALAGLSVY
jgi:hypothetical protein